MARRASAAAPGGTPPKAAPRKGAPRKGALRKGTPSARRSAAPGVAAPRSTAPGTAAVSLSRRVAGAPFARQARARAGEVLDALLAGRGWIVLVGILLAGIVFFNVDLLQRGRSIASTAERTQQLGRENARLRLELARLASSERVQEEAARQGLLLPAPGDVRYLKLRPSRDARMAAKRVTEPDPTLAAAPQLAPSQAAPQAPAPATAAPAGPAPAASQPAPAASQPPPQQAQAAPPAGTAEPAPTAQAGVDTAGAPAG